MYNGEVINSWTVSPGQYTSETILSVNNTSMSTPEVTKQQTNQYMLDFGRSPVIFDWIEQASDTGL